MAPVIEVSTSEELSSPPRTKTDPVSEKLCFLVSTTSADGGNPSNSENSGDFIKKLQFILITVP
jgi:hypothetical protein